MSRPDDPSPAPSEGHRLSATDQVAHVGGTASPETDEHGLVHRDIKPSNLFVAKSGQIKHLDLGLARLEDAEGQHGLTSSGQVLGTPDDMAPEQWDNTHGVDARADLYGLGGTLFFVLTGKAPFAEEGSKPSLMRLMKAHIEGSIPDLLDMRPDVPAELNAIYVRLLAKKPEQRFQTAAEVATALEPFLHQHDAPASGRVQSSPVAPRQESRTSLDAARATDSQATKKWEGEAPAEPRAEIDAITALLGSAGASPSRHSADSATTSIITPRPTSRGPSRRAWFIAGSILACAVLIALISRVDRGTRPTDSEISNSEISNSKSQISNLKSQISNLKFFLLP